MGIVTFSIPKDLVKKIVDHVPFKNFIETGTFRGGTAFWAAQYFEKVYTIEIDEKISNETASNPKCPRNIEFVVGNSKDVLPELLKKTKGRSFFWLDGHWCTGGGGKDDECPLMLELEALKNCKDAIIFIDDARCFLGPLPPPHRAEDWPTIAIIFDFFNDNFPEHFTTIQDDVIMSVPKDVVGIINKDWQEKFAERYGGLEKYSKKDLIKMLFR